MTNKERITVRLPAELNKKIGIHTEQLGISKNAFVLNLINKELAKKKDTQMKR